MTEKKTLMTFPCDFALKIIGVSSDHYIQDITRIILSHFPETLPHHIVSNPSKNNNYTAMTATVHALNQESLDKLYQELTQYPGIKMVL